MKKVLVAVFCFLFILNSSVCVSAEELSLSAKAAVLIAADSREVLFTKNADTRLSMASTTKIMTALILAEQEDLTKTVKITDEMVRVEGSSMGLMPGDVVTYLDLIYGMLLPSGNDAANTTAYILGGNKEGFAELMNKKAREIGLKNTNFVTPSGLDDENHFTTAYDLAILTSFALKNPVFKEVCSTKYKTLEFGNPPAKHTYQNHNKLLENYDGVIGVKTGFTKKSGRCLVTAAERNGATIIAVTLNAPNGSGDHKKMLDFGFDRVSAVTIDPKIPESVSVISGDCDKVKISTVPKSFTLSDSALFNIKTKVLLPKFLYSGIKAGQTVGRVQYYFENRLIGEEEIISAADVHLRNNKPAFKQRFIENLSKILRLVV